MSKQIAIIGAGVIGLSAAFECLRRGHHVTVLEKGVCGGQASGAAAGMLAPYSENAEGADPFFKLCHASLKLYPDWAAEVKKSSGMAFEYVQSGSLNVVFHEADLLALETRKIWQNEHGADAEIIEGAALERMEPNLSREVAAALHYPAESHLYAPDYVKALEIACKKLGADIYEHAADIQIDPSEDGVLIRFTREQSAFSVQADELILCTGAWTQEWETIFGARLPVQPIRGQICAYKNAPSFQHMVFGYQGYLVQKENGSLVCGASEDLAGFDDTITDKGIGRLLKWSRKLCPDIREEQLYHKWAGLRPSTPDGRPYIGRLSKARRVVIAAGHYRNGILLSPVTAYMTADLIEGKEERWDFGSFDPERFGYAAFAG